MSLLLVDNNITWPKSIGPPDKLTYSRCIGKNIKDTNNYLLEYYWNKLNIHRWLIVSDNQSYLLPLPFDADNNLDFFIVEHHPATIGNFIVNSQRRDDNSLVLVHLLIIVDNEASGVKETTVRSEVKESERTEASNTFKIVKSNIITNKFGYKLYDIQAPNETVVNIKFPADPSYALSTLIWYYQRANVELDAYQLSSKFPFMKLDINENIIAWFWWRYIISYQEGNVYIFDEVARQKDLILSDIINYDLYVFNDIMECYLLGVDSITILTFKGKINPIRSIMGELSEVNENSEMDERNAVTNISYLTINISNHKYDKITGNINNILLTNDNSWELIGITNNINSKGNGKVVL